MRGGGTKSTPSTRPKTGIPQHLNNYTVSQFKPKVKRSHEIRGVLLVFIHSFHLGTI